MAKPKRKFEPNGDSAKAPLKAFVERIERLEEDKKTVAVDISEVYKEAKGDGFDVKAIRAIIRMRKQDTTARHEQEAIIEVYMQCLGMLADLPLGQAAIERATGALAAG